MSYNYQGKQTIEQELEAARAEAEARKVAAAEAREQLKTLRDARRKAQEFTAKQEAIEREIYTLTHAVKLPPPIHGGRRGLEAAAAEAHGWWTRKQASA